MSKTQSIFQIKFKDFQTINEQPSGILIVVFIKMKTFMQTLLLQATKDNFINDENQFKKTIQLLFLTFKVFFFRSGKKNCSKLS